MEPTQGDPGQADPATGTPPRKRRRRWLIVAFVLVLVSLTAWWNWRVVSELFPLWVVVGMR